MNNDEFMESIYEGMEEQLKETYKKKKESRDELLKAIAMIMLTYTVLNDVLSLSEKDYNKQYNLLSTLIIKLTKGDIQQIQDNTINILRNTVKNTYNHYSYNHNLKDAEKIINQNFKGKHFSSRIWDNEQEVAKTLTKQCQDFLKGKINVNQIANEIKNTYNTSAYNAKRLTETEVARCQSKAFDRFCKEVGVKKVIYRATLCNSCEHCLGLDGEIFDFKDKPELPRHPMCKCYYDIADDNKKVTTSNKNDIIKETAVASVRFVNSKDNLFVFSKNIKPIEGYEDIVIHGDKYGFAYRDLDGNEDNISVKEFAEILKSSPLYKGGNIRLISCQTGAEDGIVAQKLADLLGVEVMAPNDVVWIYPNGDIVIGPTEYENSGKWLIYKPKE